MIMQRTILHRSHAFALLLVGLLASGPVLAAKPETAGGGQEHKRGQDNQQRGHKNQREVDTRHGMGRDNDANSNDRRARDDKGNRESRARDDNANREGRHGDRFANRDDDHPRQGAFFDDQRRTRINDYYAERIRAGRCPPGLAKKNNGCMPPGHAKRWMVGQRLPSDVIFYDLSPDILLHLGPPPPQHRYARVSNDILLIEMVTGLVVDGIQSLGGN